MTSAGLTVSIINFVGLVALILLCVGLFAGIRGVRPGRTYSLVLPYLWIVLLAQSVTNFVVSDTGLAILHLGMSAIALDLWMKYRRAGDLADEVGT